MFVTRLSLEGGANVAYETTELRVPVSTPIRHVRISFTSFNAPRLAPMSGPPVPDEWLSYQTEVAEGLRRMGMSLDPRALVDALRVAIKQMSAETRVADPLHDLTPGEVQAIQRGGLDAAQAREGVARAFMRTAATYAELIASSYAVPSVARMLGVNESRVRQRLIKGTLYGFKVNGDWRIPAFQFYHGHPIPGIEQVFARLAPDLHPIEILNWFTSANVDLQVGEYEEPVSPREWLVAGHPVDLVAALAAEL